MRAVRLHDVNDIRFEEVELACMPADGHVRLKVAYAGICGSDIHNYKTGQWISRRPSTAGHEFSGIVDAIGEGVSGFAPGDKVVADSRDYCAKCAKCDADQPHLCENLGFVGESIDGGFADFVDLPERLVFRVAPETQLDVLTLAEPLAVALHALAMMDVSDRPLLVIGCGPIGALAAVASRYTSNREVFVCDQNHERATAVAQAADAAAVSLADFESLSKNSTHPVSQVLDTTGHVSVIRTVLNSLAGGTLGLVGIGSGKIEFDPVQAVEREFRIVGCHAFTDEMFPAIALLEKHSEVFESLIRHRVSLEDVPSEYARIVNGKARGIKTLIKINPE
ncbi:zinc-binding dehydrogenase [Roseobacter sp.]|uniref:zinc-dependent alcohol dehydrogenase n=1 Tax=Roseobacter sp. TaxID=1907202 RepID=UPI00385C06C9